MTGAAADDSEALRAALAEALPLWWKTEPPYTATIERLLPLMLAYGREQATRALRDAADVDAATVMVDPATGQPWRTTAAVSHAWRKLLDRRADDLGRQA